MNEQSVLRLSIFEVQLWSEDNETLRIILYLNFYKSNSYIKIAITH